MQIEFSVNDWVRVPFYHAVYIDSNSDVAGFTPSRAPLVSHDPVFSGSRDTPADSGNILEVLSPTAGLVVYTASIPWIFIIGFNINGNWA